MLRRQRAIMVHQALDTALESPRGAGFESDIGLDPVRRQLESSHSSNITLFDRVSRGKARWLKRVMYETPATSTEKCFAYAVADHLNCVTLDCWPSQFRCAQLLGFRSTKTPQRAARGLERLEVIEIRSNGTSGYRYAPVFMPGDMDKFVAPIGQTCPPSADRNVMESLLPIHPNQSSSTQELASARPAEEPRRSYDRRRRGEIERAIATLLGSSGFEILQKLGALDDAIVERLCRASAEGALGERELTAARLAAQQFG